MCKGTGARNSMRCFANSKLLGIVGAEGVCVGVGVGSVDGQEGGGIEGSGAQRRWGWRGKLQPVMQGLVRCTWKPALSSVGSGIIGLFAGHGIRVVTQISGSSIPSNILPFIHLYL